MAKTGRGIKKQKERKIRKRGKGKHNPTHDRNNLKRSLALNFNISENLAFNFNTSENHAIYSVSLLYSI